MESQVQMTVSFNGKARFQKLFPAGASKDDIISATLADERSARYLEGKTIVKQIVVPGRIINLVVR